MNSSVLASSYVYYRQFERSRFNDSTGGISHHAIHRSQKAEVAFLSRINNKGCFLVILAELLDMFDDNAACCVCIWIGEN